MKKYFHYLITIFFCFFLDQITKKLCNFEKNFEISNFKIIFSNVYNHGFALGIMDETFNKRQILIIALILIFLLLFIYNSIKKHIFENKLIVFETIIIGGALSNIFDRIFHGHVIDFISIKYLNFTLIPFFNLADFFITFGVFFIIVDILLYKKKLKQ